MLLRCAFVVDALLGFALLALPFGAALLVFHYVLAQLAVGAEEAAIRDYKVGFLVLFVWHSLAFRYSLFVLSRYESLWKGSAATVAFCSPICTAVPGTAISRCAYPSANVRSPLGNGTRAELVISPAFLSLTRTLVPGSGGPPSTSNPTKLRCRIARERMRSTISCPM